MIPPRTTLSILKDIDQPLQCRLCCTAYFRSKHQTCRERPTIGTPCSYEVGAAVDEDCLTVDTGAVIREQKCHHRGEILRDSKSRRPHCVHPLIAQTECPIHLNTNKGRRSKWSDRILGSARILGVERGTYRVVCFFILSCLIFKSSVDRGIPSLAAAPFGPATFPLLSARAASMSSFS